MTITETTGEKKGPLTPGQEAHQQLATLFNAMETVSESDWETKKQRVLPDGTQLQVSRRTQYDIYDVTVTSGSGMRRMSFFITPGGLNGFSIPKVETKIGEWTLESNKELKIYPTDARVIQTQSFRDAAKPFVALCSDMIAQGKYISPFSSMVTQQQNP